jgi:pilus assembly protein CpaC
MAEVVERVDREFGLEWSSFGEFQVLPKADFATSLTATLKALESRGLGKILATPRILCRSGAEAEFHSGGEFPIPVTEYQSHYKTQNIIWKKHGIVLKFKPQADRQGRMSIKIYAELSVLSEQQAGGVPALLINKIESEFDLSKPQTVALSGLIRQDWLKGRSGLPWISQIPVLGSLFGSENFLNRKSELVIFVTPRILRETGSDTRMPEGWNRDAL